MKAGAQLDVGTIVGRRFREKDEGHVAVVVEGRLLLQSFPTDSSAFPGVNMLLTVSQSEAWFRQGKPYFEYAVPYEAWVKRLKRKPV